MTDTAQPFPNELADDPGALTPVQRQRAAALDVARAALLSRTGLFGGAQVGPSFDTIDLMSVADWVLGDPDDPMVQPREALALPGSENYDGVPAPLPVGLEHVATFRPSALDDAQPLAAEDEEEREAYDDTQDDTDVLPAYPEDALPR